MNKRKVAVVLFVLYMGIIPLIGGMTLKDNGETTQIDYTSKVILYDEGKDQCFTCTVEEFIIGAIGVEMPITYDFDALVAQGIAAHSYLRYSQQCANTPQGGYLTVNPDQHIGYMTNAQLKEIYKDSYPQYEELLTAAAKEAKNYILTYEGQPILAAYHAISNGMTESSQNVWGRSLPYLQGVESKEDRNAQGYETTLLYYGNELRDRIVAYIPEVLLPEDPTTWIDIQSRTSSGYIDTVEIGGVITTGQILRQILSARSGDITFTYNNSGQFVFTVYGYGHGVGLSQVGAEALAQSGKTYEEILTYYYQGAELTPIP